MTQENRRVRDSRAAADRSVVDGSGIRRVATVWPPVSAKSATVRGALLAAVLFVSVACGDTSTPGQAQVSPATPTAVSPSPSASPSTTPVAAKTVVTFLNAPLTVARGSNATLQVKTGANTSCSIEVDYKSGPSSAAGLATKNSDGAGNVSWTWKVGANTTPGAWPITVTCGDASAQTHITVT